jgi:hypothetical protein
MRYLILLLFFSNLGTLLSSSHAMAPLTATSGTTDDRMGLKRLRPSRSSM